MKVFLVILMLTFLAILGVGCIGQRPELMPPGTPGTPPQEIAPESTVGVPCTGSPGRLVGFEPSGEYRVGDRIIFSGTTNLAPGNEVLVVVRSVSFRPTLKTDENRGSAISAIVVVDRDAGEPGNRWRYLLDTAGFEPDQYQVEVSGITVPLFRKSWAFTLHA